MSLSIIADQTFFLNVIYLLSCCRKVVTTVDTTNLVFRTPGNSFFLFYDLKDFVEGLLDRNPRQRLGLQGGEEVKQHPMFAYEVKKKEKSFPCFDLWHFPASLVDFDVDLEMKQSSSHNTGI